MQIGPSRFHDWLLNQQLEELRPLKEQARNDPDWKNVTRFQDAWALINAYSAKTEDERKSLIGMAVLAFQSFESAQPTQRSGWTTAFGLGVFLFMAMILVILFMAIFEPTLFAGNFSKQTVEPLLSRLADLETSRGLITFVFTVGVIALALIIVTANVTSSDGEGARFERSKEILTSLIAILGTILGFYFGKTDPSPVQAAPVVQTETDTQQTDTDRDAEREEGADGPASDVQSQAEAETPQDDPSAVVEDNAGPDQDPPPPSATPTVDE